MSSIQTTLPGASDAGTARRWSLPVNDGDDKFAETRYVEVYGRFLGIGSSHTERHSNHDTDRNGQLVRYVKKGVRCNACRWFEARIFREILLPDGVERVEDVGDRFDELDLGDYLVHNAGMSSVNGEVPFYKYEVTRSPYQVIELMTTRRTTDAGPSVFLAKPAAHALAAAAGFDEELRDAYVNRAVS